MKLSRRELLTKSIGAGALLGTTSALSGKEAPSTVSSAFQPGTSKKRFPLAVSTYSYWHFTPQKYPIEKVIDNAARIGFDGVEILHRQMAEESTAYMNNLKRRAFAAGLDLVMLSIHQDFVNPDKAERQKDIDHTKHWCCRQTVSSAMVGVARGPLPI